MKWKNIFDDIMKYELIQNYNDMKLESKRELKNLKFPQRKQKKEEEKKK